MAKAKPKLPPVWVMFDEKMNLCAFPSVRKWNLRGEPWGTTQARYVPAASAKPKVKVCKVRGLRFGDMNETSCGIFPTLFRYCPYCQGEIKR